MKIDFTKLKKMMLLGGSGLALIGAVKIAHHTLTDPFVQSICGNMSFLDMLLFSNTHSSHCWGCGAAMAGLAMVVASFITESEPVTELAPAPIK